ncbi:MAG: NAD(P)-dependent oxidoreductase [Planctomycetota bacterium]|jgi:D-3-phosphoglycerate dehydrogenase
MQFRVLITAPYMQMVIDRFRPIFEKKQIELIIPKTSERFEEEELLELVSDVDGVICGDDRFTDHVLSVAGRLKVLSKWGTGIDSIDQVSCRKRGVALYNTPDAFSAAVADSVLGYIINFARKLPLMDNSMKQGRWEKTINLALNECTLGVIGVGNVGKRVVKRAVGCDMCVLGNDLIDMPKGFLEDTGIEMVSRRELLERADFVSLNCDLNETSFHLMSDKEFDVMDSTAVLINTSRGPVVDEAALVGALRQGKISGAALDVFEVEPLASNSPLLEMDNVMLAPHNANSSVRAWEHVHENTVNNLLKGLGISN